MADIGSEKTRITPSQRRAIAALLTSRTVGAAAQAAKVGERTLYRWLADPVFRVALAEAENAVIDEATRRLIAGQGQALDVLENIRDKPDAKDSDRRLTVVAWLDFLIRWRELQTTEQRLARLEEVVYGAKH